MNSQIRSWLVCLIPFLVSGGMALGGAIGMDSFFYTALQEDSAGDLAGAAGALMVLICIVTGFVIATLTIIVAKVIGRSTPDRIALRLVLSFVGGGMVGFLAVYADVETAVSPWIVLICGPAMLALFCGTGKRFPA